MRRLPHLFLTLFISIFIVVTLSAAQDVTPLSRALSYSQMAQKAADQGSIRVIVQLDVPEIESLATASAQFKAGRSNALNMVQAAMADGALTAQIADTADVMLNRMDTASFQVQRRYSTLPLVALDVSPEALDALANDPQVVQITEDRLLRPLLDNTTDIIGATDSWSNGFSGDGWYVAILDSGILRTHNFFTGKDIVEACFSAGNDCPGNTSSDTGAGAAAHYADTYVGWDHGTHVAGIAAGNNGSTLYGVARDADIIAVQVFSRFDDYAGCGVAPDDDCVLAYDSDILAGLNHIYSLRTTYNIASVNLSLGDPSTIFSSFCDSSYLAYKTTIDQLNSAGIATVVASGNGSNCGGVSPPSCISTAISVGATSDADVMANFSNYHADLVDLFAPGVSINASVADSDTSYSSWSGTSMATPHVTGAFALLRQADGTSSVTDLLDTLKSNGANATGSANCATDGDTLPVQRIQVYDAISPSPPTAPDGLTATTADWNQINLSWSDNANNEQGFRIERKTGTGGTYSEIAEIGANTTTYNDNSSLSEGTSYYYQVQAYNGVGNSAYSAEANDTTLLVNPEDFNATAFSTTQINLAWTDSSASESGFEIEQRNGSSSFTPIATVGANVESYSDTGLIAGRNYYYRIRSVNGSLTSSYAESYATTNSIVNSGDDNDRSSNGNSGGCFISAVVQ